MHEMTLIYGIAETVQQVEKENGLDHIDAVVIQVGEISGVIAEFMEEFYPMLAEDLPALNGSELIVEKIPAVGRCRKCGKEYDIVPYEGHCPVCGSVEKEILSGMDFVIKEIRIYEPAEGAPDQ